MEIALRAQGIDFGAGSGPLITLMRSIGRDFRSFDRFSALLFSSDYTLEDLGDEGPEIIIELLDFRALAEACGNPWLSSFPLVSM